MLLGQLLTKSHIISSLANTEPIDPETSTREDPINARLIKSSTTKIIISSIIIPENTPAITIVGLCNRADIGVGADIAFNNHVENVNLG